MAKKGKTLLTRNSKDKDNKDKDNKDNTPAQGAPTCPVKGCGRTMRKSHDHDGKPIWICPLHPDQSARPRQEK